MSDSPRTVPFDPEDWSTWTHEDFVADARRMAAEDAMRPPPTAEELEMGLRFLRKQESACGWNQRDPNAKSDAP
jgi:hypothetical protein